MLQSHTMRPHLFLLQSRMLQDCTICPHKHMLVRLCSMWLCSMHWCGWLCSTMRLCSKHWCGQTLGKMMTETDGRTPDRCITLNARCCYHHHHHQFQFALPLKSTPIHSISLITVFLLLTHFAHVRSSSYVYQSLSHLLSWLKTHLFHKSFLPDYHHRLGTGLYLICKMVFLFNFFIAFLL